MSDCQHCWRPANYETGLCDLCEDIAIERSKIDQEWRKYEGTAAPETEKPHYPQRLAGKR